MDERAERPRVQPDIGQLINRRLAAFGQTAGELLLPHHINCGRHVA
jgi:hypothetical protein